MNDARGKILLLVEGEKLEKAVFKELGNVYGMKSEIFCLRCNIFMLYGKMKQYDFNASIKDVLIENFLKDIPQKDCDMLMNNTFAYTYLVLDFDLQHSIDKMDIELMQIEEMCSYFNNETDDTVGKLYINYPMMESFRDRDDFVDHKYMDKIVYINDFKEYKRIVGKCQLAPIHIDSYTKEGFDAIIKSNLEKAYAKLFERGILDYDNYLNNIQTIAIFKKQCRYIEDSYIYVLNTSLFLLIDYFGEKFFNHLTVVG